MQDSAPEAQSKNVKNWVIVLAVVLGLIGVASAFFSKKTTSKNTIVDNSVSTPSIQTLAAEDNSGEPDKSIREFTVNGSNFKFDPVEITVNTGDRVKINFVNKDGKHDFVIDEFNVATKILNAESSETIEFIADKSGTFEYYCSVGEHRAMGMSGKLIVK